MFRKFEKIIVLLMLVCGCVSAGAQPDLLKHGQRNAMERRAGGRSPDLLPDRVIGGDVRGQGTNREQERQAGPDKTTWQAITGGEAFNYRNDVENAPVVANIEPNAFQKFIRWLVGFIGSGVGNLLVIILLVIIAAFLIYRIFISNDSLLFGKKQKKMAPDAPADQEPDDITAADWEALMKKAVEKNDLRLGVRYCYMLLLQLLQRKELINYRVDKTNFDYVMELSETAYRQPFRQLSRQYEYAWYGNFEVSAASFEQYKGVFEQVRKQLGS